MFKNWTLGDKLCGALALAVVLSLIPGLAKGLSAFL